MNDSTNTLLTANILGHPSDFLITQKRDGDQIKITVSTVMPTMRWDAERQCLLTWAPPRYPWPNGPSEPRGK